MTLVIDGTIPEAKDSKIYIVKEIIPIMYVTCVGFKNEVNIVAITSLIFIAFLENDTNKEVVNHKVLNFSQNVDIKYNRGSLKKSLDLNCTKISSHQSHLLY